ncbi:MAG TPA: ABC transporter permease [Steroidobacteraceae bacterium]|nr:ABC transporter permease [Steroidobacteraceae bacterium]
MLKHYLINAWRNLRRMPLVSSIHIIGLSLGLACFIGTFAAVRYIDSSDKQFATADRAYTITQRVHSRARDFDTGARAGTAPVLGQYVSQDLPELEAVARAETLRELDVMVDGKKTTVYGAVADADFFRIFPFAMSKDSLTDPLRQPRSVVLTKATALKLFGTTDVVGQHLTLKRTIDIHITGVLDRAPTPSQFDPSPLNALRFDILASVDVLDAIVAADGGLPPSTLPAAIQWARFAGPTYVLLPKSGAVTLERLNATLAGFPQKYVPKARRDIAEFEFRAIPASEVWKANVNTALFRGANLSITKLLQVLGVVVLALACLNYANLATAAAAARFKETGLRRVLGATRLQVIAQCIAEASLLAVIALGFAILMLLAASPFVAAATGISFAKSLAGDWVIWLSLLGAIFSAAVLSSIYPAIAMAQIRPAGALRESSRGQSTLASRALVGLQFAMSSLLLISVIVVLAQSNELRQTGLGASAGQTLLIANRDTGIDYQYDILRNELLKIPGVEVVAAADNLPWGTSFNTGAIVRSLERRDSFVSPFMHTVSPGFEKALDIPVIAGRSFDNTRADDFFSQSLPAGLRSLDSQKTYGVMIDRSLSDALGFASPVDAVDQVVFLPFGQVGGKDIAARIIGVTENKPLRLIGAGTTTNMYLSAPRIGGYPIVRIRGTDIPATLNAIDAAWSKLAPGTPLNRRFLDEQFEQNYLLFERISRVITGITGLAFAISLMGLFGMALFIVNRRRREIGVRKTLGATVQRILLMLLRDFAKPVVIANIAIWPVGYLAANAYLGSFTHRIALTPVPFVASLLITLLIAWLAVGSNAIRAARLNPTAVLRYE